MLHRFLRNLQIEYSAVPAISPIVRQDLRLVLNAMDIEKSLLDDILLAVGECINNAIEHAYRDREPGNLVVTAYTTVDVDAENDDAYTKLNIQVDDRGKWKPRIEESSHSSRGRGIMLMKALAEKVEVEKNIAGGTAIRLVFSINKTPISLVEE